MIETSHQDGVTEIVLDSPGRLNALDEGSLASLADAYDRAEHRGARAVLLHGRGRGFCAGRDVSGVTPADDDALAFLRDHVTPVLRRIEGFPAPTFAAVHGACLGVGLGLAAASDVVYIGEGARIGSPFAALGATLDSGGHALFRERLGRQRTLDLIYTGELMSGKEAAEAGLFARCVADDDLLEFARARARRAAEGPALAFAESKALMRTLDESAMGFWEVLQAENEAQGRLSRTADYAEGFAAFQQKRTPRFGDR